MAHKVYRAIQTPITFQDSGGSVAITLQNLAAGAGRVSARYDRGAGDLPAQYRWRAVFQWTTTPVRGQYAEIYLVESDGTLVDGTLGSTNAAVSTYGQLENCYRIGSVFVQTAAAATNMIASGECTILDRYFSVAVWNDGTVNLQNTANVSFVILTPVPDELQ
jgi:hypothetical protein